MRPCLALLFASALPALLLAAPAPQPKDELPKLILDAIKDERESMDSRIHIARDYMKRPSLAKQRGYYAEKIRDYERLYYDRAIGRLQTMRDYPEYTDLKRKLTPEESRAFDRAIREYIRQRNEAIRKGEASAKRQLEP